MDGRRCSKLIIGLINSAIIIAAAVACVAIYLQWNGIPWDEVSALKTIIILVVAVSVIAVVSALIGLFALCVRACKKAYLVIILVVLIFEVVVLALAFVFRGQVDTQIEDIWKSDDSNIQAVRKKLELHFECCGWNSTDNENTTLEDCGFQPERAVDIPTCKDAILEEGRRILIGVASAVIVLVVIELALLVAAIYLLCKGEPNDDFGVTKF
jgi:hypothetical protein